MHILIVKHGALGDVVRTSYFANALKKKYGSGLRLSWITSCDAKPLLEFNPAIDDLWTKFPRFDSFDFDQVFSLDDEREVVEKVMKLKIKKITGAYLDNFQNLTYTDDVATWFDMGLLSKFGKEKADKLKVKNTLTHSEIFSKIFNVSSVEPIFFNGNLYSEVMPLMKTGVIRIGINPYAGGRWKSKELRGEEIELLVISLLNIHHKLGCEIEIYLFGAGQDMLRNIKLQQKIGSSRVLVPNTERNVMVLAGFINALDLLITSDSLALHLAIAQKVKFVAFFSPTSANEIDDFGFGVKIKSTSSDYCSYKSDADNSSITAERIIKAITTY